MLLLILIVLAVGGGLLGLLLRLLKKPIKWFFKLLLHALFGYVYLFIFNFVGAWFGVSLEITWLTAVVSGVFGVPGVAVLLLLKYVL